MYLDACMYGMKSERVCVYSLKTREGVCSQLENERERESVYSLKMRERGRERERASGEGFHSRLITAAALM